MTEGKTLHFKKMGEGPNLIILHGLFGMLDNWQTVGRAFSEHYTVWLVDLRNHGRSFHESAFDYYLMANDVIEFMEEHEIEHASILGHSMGGKVAMQAACDHPERFDSLIVVDIAPKDYPPGHQEVFDAFDAVDLLVVRTRPEAETQMKTVMDDNGVVQFLLKNLKRSKDGPYFWKANIKSIRVNYDSIIQNSLSPFATFDYPTLFIKGGNSERYITDSDSEKIEKHFPSAELHTIEGAGHWVHAEKPEELIKEVLRFLSESLS